MTSLKYIDLTNNALTNLQEGTYSHFDKNSIIIKLAGNNQISCCNSWTEVSYLYNLKTVEQQFKCNSGNGVVGFDSFGQMCPQTITGNNGNNDGKAKKKNALGDKSALDFVLDEAVPHY
eukprot:Pgem_evm1s9307